MKKYLNFSFLIYLLLILKLLDANYDNTNEEFKGHAWENSGFFEGDILVTSMSRNGLSDEATRWPKREMPYIVSPSYEPYQKQMIKKALDVINKVSCVNIRPKKEKDIHYINIADRKKGCSSFIGFLGIGEQEMNLDSANCFTKLGTIIHEFMHCLGFIHQHSSYERDKYINIRWKNIDPQYNGNFMKYSDREVTNFGVEYDTSSIMHYSSYAFSKNGNATMKSKSAHNAYNEDIEMGQRDRLTKKDIIKLNKMYKCPGY